MAQELKPCDNIECERMVRIGCVFCCLPCRLANRKYEIHESGILAHSPGCNERLEQRTKPEPG